MAVSFAVFINSLSITASAGTYTLNVKPYGAISNDNLDDSEAIQQAINDVERRGGGVVQLNTGTYLLNKPIYAKSNVTLRGDGSKKTMLKKIPSSKLAWGDTVIIMGNVTPVNLFYNEGKGFQEQDARLLKDGSISLKQAPSDLKVGQIVWLATSEKFYHISVGGKKIDRPNYSVMNTVKSIKGNIVSFTYPNFFPKNSVNIKFNYANKTLKDVNKESIAPIYQASITDLSVYADDESAILMGGCLKCRITNINIERSVRLLSVQATRFSVFSNITGNFTHKGVEWSILATDNIVSGLNAKSIQPTTLEERRDDIVRPVLRFGESAARNTIYKSNFELDDRFQNIKLIRFDNSKNNSLVGVNISLTKLEKEPVVFLYHKRINDEGELPGGSNGILGLTIRAKVINPTLSGSEVIISKDVEIVEDDKGIDSVKRTLKTVNNKRFFHRLHSEQSKKKGKKVLTINLLQKEESYLTSLLSSVKK